MSLMHMKTRYRLDSGGTYPSFMEMSPPTSDGEEEEMQKFKITPFTKVRRYTCGRAIHKLRCIHAYPVIGVGVKYVLTFDRGLF